MLLMYHLSRFMEISKRHPYFWSKQDCEAIITEIMENAKTKYAKQARDDNGEIYSLYYYNIPVAFDIEDSSFYDQEQYTMEAMEEPRKISVMYVWQLGLDNVVIMGRTWDDFLECLDVFRRFTSESKRVIIYVHFLDHEFQFMRKWIEWDKVFSRKTRSPIYAITGGIEFRDSYILTGKSLAKTAEDIRSDRGLRKRVGDLDYTKIRGEKTHLTRKEIGYCMADVQILNTYIREKIEENGDNIGRIPLTNTGYVRRYVRKECLPTKKNKIEERNLYYNGIHSLNLTPKEYKLLKRAFQGGFTHANALYIDDTITGRIDSFDFTSSYPAVILSMPFPSSSGIEVHPKSQSELDTYLSSYLSIFTIRFYNIREKPDAPDNIISSSKCWDVVRGVYNNGRLVSAVTVTTALSNVDLESVKRFYDYDYYNIGTMYIYDKGYLPKPIIECVLELYRAKTELKGVIGAEIEYMLKKGMLNSVY